MFESLAELGKRVVDTYFTCRACDRFANIEMDCCGAIVCKSCLVRRTRVERDYVVTECPGCLRDLRTRRRS